MAKYDKSLVTYHQRQSLASEAYRAIRTNLLFYKTAGEDSSQVIAITSAGAGEGKSTTAANTAFVLAQANYKTLLIDADMRKPKLHEIFGLDSSDGLSNVLEGSKSFEDCVKHTDLPELDVLISNTHYAEPAELLTSKKLVEFINDMRVRYDIIIFDTPPIGFLTDSTLIVTQADGVLLVVSERGVSANELKYVRQHLNYVGVKLLGLVYNKASKSSNYGKYYDYYSYYTTQDNKFIGKFKRILSRFKRVQK